MIARFLNHQQFFPSPDLVDPLVICGCQFFPSVSRMDLPPGPQDAIVTRIFRHWDWLRNPNLDLNLPFVTVVGGRPKVSVFIANMFLCVFLVSFPKLQLVSKKCSIKRTLERGNLLVFSHENFRIKKPRFLPFKKKCPSFKPQTSRLWFCWSSVLDSVAWQHQNVGGRSRAPIGLCHLPFLRDKWWLVR